MSSEARKAYRRQWYLKNRKLTIKRAAAWAEAHPEKVRGYKRKYMRAQYQANPEKMRERSRRFNKAHPEKQSAWRKAHPEKRRLYQRKYAKANPEKIKAHNALGHAIRSGKITRGPCAKCGDPKTEKHHPDYSKPLVAVDMCHLDHVQLHPR
jgi:hypothetical protein